MKRKTHMITMVTFIAFLAFAATTVWSADSSQTVKPVTGAPQLKTPAAATTPGTLKTPGQPTVQGLPAKTPDSKINPSTMRLQPDLTITNVKIEPINPNTTDAIKFSAVLTNTGKAMAPASKVAVFVGGETTPVSFNLPPIAPNASRLVVREAHLPKEGAYRVRFVADPDAVVSESNEANNTAIYNFRVAAGVPQSAAVAVARPAVSEAIQDIAHVQFAFQIGEANMQTYSFPGNSNFVFYMRPTKSVDTGTVAENAIQVHLKYFNNGTLQSEETLSGHFASKGPDLMRWESDQTPYGGNCTSSSTCYCELNLTLQDSILSQDGVQLDGDKDGQPGGDFHKQFFRGMSHP